MSKNGDIEAALSTVKDNTEIFTFTTGVRVRLLPVNPMLTQAAMARIKDPAVPIIVDKEQGKEYANPNDPVYQRELEDANVQRGYARLNTIILWSIELVDGLPESDDWLYKLQFQERQGDLDLSPFDFENPIDKEFAFKKFIAIGDTVNENGENIDINLILDQGIVDSEAVDIASETFPGEETRTSDTNGASQESEGVSAERY